ncbi:MAG: M1 family metallopeptidase [Lachnospiraceae bacterium]|nr:M1 family metallopeptidase [Lachnospiraceae bacterium]
MKIQTKQIYIILLTILICVIAMCGCSQTKVLSFETSYAIDADLNPEIRCMTYTEKVKVVNTGSDSTKTLYFHIYGNKFRGLRQVEDGNIVVLSAQDQEGNVLQCQREQEGVLYCVKLAEKLKPEQSTELTFTCEVLIPDLESMYGMSEAGDVQLPMFSLQLAMYDENGWDIAPLPENGDGRYGATADYDLTIHIPETYILTCNGDELSRETSNGITTYTYRAEKRRDIMVFACKDYVRLERIVGDTTILGCFNEALDSVTRQRMEYVMDCAAFALQYFNGILGEYPYDTLVVTNSAIGTNFSPNMEYSGLITVLFGSQQFSMKINTFHEVAHQWFYGLVGNDENRKPWLDEGFAEFAAGLCLDAEGEEDFPYWELKNISNSAVAEEKVNVSSDDASNYQWVIYDRGAVFLKTLMDTIGQEKFLSILSDYCQRYKYGVATTENFLEILCESTDVDISEIVDAFIERK